MCVSARVPLCACACDGRKRHILRCDTDTHTSGTCYKELKACELQTHTPLRSRARQGGHATHLILPHTTSHFHARFKTLFVFDFLQRFNDIYTCAENDHTKAVRRGHSRRGCLPVARLQSMMQIAAAGRVSSTFIE